VGESFPGPGSHEVPGIRLHLLTMVKTTKEIESRHFGRVLAALLLVASMAFLGGCQGVSAGPSKTQVLVGTLSLQSSSLDFGSVTAGSSKTMTVNATNSGAGPITVSSVTISTKYFSLMSPSLPATVAAGASLPVSVKFSPNATGTFTANVTITSDAQNSVTNLSLTGTGTAAPEGQLSSNPTSEDFGSLTVGSQQSKTVTLTNTGGASVDISQASISGTGFRLSGISTPLTLNASQSTTLSVTFAPQAAGAASGTVTITSNGSNPTLTIALSGTGTSPGALGANPASLSFGNVTVGSKQSLSEKITNTGGSDVTISQVGINGSGFGLSGISAPVTLTAGQSLTFNVTFTPTSSGSASGSVTVSSTASNPTLTISLSGTGTAAVGQLGVSPTTLAIGNVVVGTSGTASGSLTASSASVKVTAAGTNNSAFTVSGLSLPVTIPAGQSVPFTVNFDPQTTGAASATLTFTSDAQPSTTTETLTGTGTPAPTHTVNLSWDASTSSNISGYNIYRAVYTTSCGSFAKINSTLNTTTLYSDLVVTDGTSYCYATTAVSTSQEESGYSNIVSNVQIPAP